MIARRLIFGAAVLGAGVLFNARTVRAGDPWRGVWIWDRPRANLEAQPAGERYFRKTFELTAAANQAHTLVLADNRFKLFVNGVAVGEGADWQLPVEFDIARHLRSGRNVIAVRATNDEAMAGLFFECDLKTSKGEMIHIVTDGSWRAAARADGEWTAVDYDDSGWQPAVELGPMGTPPWGKQGKPGDTGSRPPSDRPLPAAESMKLFTMQEGFEIRCVAEEPEVINPVAMAVDERGRLFVAEAHTYRYGAEGTPVKPPTNPVVMLEIGADGKARRKAVVAQGFEDPVMGLAVRGGKIWMAALNQLIVADLRPDGSAVDGTAGERRVIVHDVAKPWNPFGMYRVAYGPDGWLYLIVGDHEVEMIGSDGTTIKTRGPTGSLFRLRPDGTKLQLLVQGMRAPFSFDFDAYGHLWVLSNGEGNPNRLLMAIPGVDYHFQTRHGDWNWLAGIHPWSPPVTEMERGANTQVLCYMDAAFPERYWGSLFVANWGAHGFASVNHKIDLYVPNERGGIEDVSVFLESSDPMFRPTQLVPDRDGNLFMLDWYGRDDENDLTGRIYKIVSAKRSEVRMQDESVVRSLAGLPDEQGKALLNLASRSSWEREEAIQYLASRKDMLVTLYLEWDADPFAVAQALWVLRRMETPEAVKAIGQTLQNSKHAAIRAMCVRMLRDMNASEVAAGIALMRNDPDPEGRVESALCVPTMPKWEMLCLVGALEAGAIRDRRLRYQCAVELSRRMSAEEFAALANSSEELMQLVAWIALDVGLLEATNPAARQVFTMLLNSPPPGREHEILELAGRWATPAEIPALQAFLRRESTAGGNAEHIGAALAILRRFGPDAMAGVPADAIPKFFDGIAAGKIALPAPADRLGALSLIESADVGPAGVAFVKACLGDPEGAVRQQALRTVRTIGWQHPELFDEVWRLVNGERDGSAAAGGAAGRQTSPEERLTAIATLGAEESPAPAKWKFLLESLDPIVARLALRTCKQFSTDAGIRDMLVAAAPRLMAAHKDLGDEFSAALALFGIEKETLQKLDLPPPLTASESDAIVQEMLGRVAGGNVRLGQEVYERLGCAACHDVAGETKLFGPALRGIGKAATPTSIAESILFPGRVIKDGFETQVVRLKNGQELEGWVEQHGNEVIVVRGAGERVRVAADEIVERRKLDKSPMPDVSLDGVSAGELSDLLAYLVSQGSDPKGAAATQATVRSDRTPKRRNHLQPVK